MSFAFLTHLELKHMFRKLIVFHCFEIFARAYNRHLEYGDLEKFPIEIQRKFVKINHWWKFRKLLSDYSPLEDKEFIIELLDIWEYL